MHFGKFEVKPIEAPEKSLSEWTVPDKLKAGAAGRHKKQNQSTCTGNQCRKIPAPATQWRHMGRSNWKLKVDSRRRRCSWQQKRDKS